MGVKLALASKIVSPDCGLSTGHAYFLQLSLPTELSPPHPHQTYRKMPDSHSPSRQLHRNTSTAASASLWHACSPAKTDFPDRHEMRMYRGGRFEVECREVCSVCFGQFPHADRTCNRKTGRDL